MPDYRGDAVQRASGTFFWRNGGDVVAGAVEHTPESEELAELLAYWGLTYVRQRHDLSLAGSPQRSLRRFAVEAADASLYLLERVPSGRRLVKTRIATMLAHLRRQGLAEVNPYLPAVGGAFLADHHGALWQLSPFVAGEALLRPTYVLEAWRGEALAGFLAHLRACAVHVPGYDEADCFLLPRFTRHLLARVRGKHPELLTRLRPATDLLECGLFTELAALPVAFCHGDVHALNVIWGIGQIRAVIDWEFSGYKPAPYDLAVLIGCVGVEQPAALRSALVSSLLRPLQQSDYLDAASWRLLPEMVLATRLLWLSDWLRVRDVEMVELELDYIGLLVARLEELRSAWGVPAALG